MKSVQSFARAATLVVLATAGAAGQAATISAVSNNPLLFSWNYDTGSSFLTGSGSIVTSGFNSNLLSLTVTLDNTSAIGGIGGERLTAFGFGIDPNAVSVAFVDGNDGGMVNAVKGQNFPAYQSVEICAIGGTTCAGGSNGGVYAGTSDTFTIQLGGTWGSSVNVDPLALKYQTGYGSFEFTASPPRTRVPEPSTLALVGLGLLGVARVRRAHTTA